MKSCMRHNDIEIYSTHSEGKSFVAERFIRTLKNKIYKYISLISKNMYIDKLDNIVNKYNNTYQILKFKVYQILILNFKVGNHKRILKYKNIFASGSSGNWSEEVFVIKKVKNTVLCAYLIRDFNPMPGRLF